MLILPDQISLVTPSKKIRMSDKVEFNASQIYRVHQIVLLGTLVDARKQIHQIAQ
jgi:hypothetical protein